jgi:hypothetical protein
MSDSMSWSWVAAAFVVPLALATGIAWPMWGRTRDSMGSIIGAFVVFVFAIGFAGREYIHIQRLTEQCLSAGVICRFSPEPFTRFGIYMFIAMAQACLLFTVGAAIEHRMENRAFSATWRR